MLKRTIKYKNFKEEDREGIFYFNLTQEELLLMSLGDEGTDIAAHFQGLMDRKDEAAIIRELRELILQAYGIRSDDGEYFDKSPEIRQKFVRSAAYSALFVEILSDPEAMLDFFIGTLPKSLQGDFKESTAKAMSMAEATYKNVPLPPPNPPTA